MGEENGIAWKGGQRAERFARVLAFRCGFGFPHYRDVPNRSACTIYLERGVALLFGTANDLFGIYIYVCIYIYIYIVTVDRYIYYIMNRYVCI
jgi:hypothetical protein